MAYVPPALVDNIIAQFHNGLGNAHESKDKTYQKIRSLYFWPTMRADIKHFILSFPACARFRKHRRLRAPLQPWQVTAPREVLAMDYFGQGTLIPTVRGNVAILTCIDLFTRFGAAFPLPDSTSETTIVAVLSGWFYRFGPPSLILTDQVANFMSNSFHEFCTAWKIHHINTSPYHPQINAACDRFNGTI